MNGLAAFPSSIRPAVAKVTAELPTPTLEPAGRFTVLVEGEPVTIPERIYFPELPPKITSRWGQVERNVYACLYSRHHDGYTRQRHLRILVKLSEPWVAPFVVRLIGEYVVEILRDIQAGLPHLEQLGTAHRTQ